MNGTLGTKFMLLDLDVIQNYVIIYGDAVVERIMKKPPNILLNNILRNSQCSQFKMMICMMQNPNELCLVLTSTKTSRRKVKMSIRS